MSLALGEPGSDLLAREVAAAASSWEVQGAKIPGGTWRPGLAQWPSFLARRQPLATSCQRADPLCGICAAIHLRPPRVLCSWPHLSLRFLANHQRESLPEY